MTVRISWREPLRSLVKFDVLINNAGISMRALFNDVDLDVLRRLMDVNFWGTVYCTKICTAPSFKNQGFGGGHYFRWRAHRLPGRTGYSASKFAVRGFLQTIRVENLKTGLHVLIVAPGFTSSEIRKSALNAQGGKQEKLHGMKAE